MALKMEMLGRAEHLRARVSRWTVPHRRVELTVREWRVAAGISGCDPGAVEDGDADDHQRLERSQRSHGYGALGEYVKERR